MGEIHSIKTLEAGFTSEQLIFLIGGNQYLYQAITSNKKKLNISSLKTPAQLKAVLKVVDYILDRPTKKNDYITEKPDASASTLKIDRLDILLTIPIDEEEKKTYLKKLKSDIEAQIKMLTPQSQEPQIQAKTPNLELSKNELEAEIHRIFKKIEFDQLQLGLTLTDEQKNVYEAFWFRNKDNLQGLLSRSVGELTGEDWEDLLNKANIKINNKKLRLLNQIAINTRRMNTLALDQLEEQDKVYNAVVEQLNWGESGLFFQSQSSYAYLSNLPVIAPHEQKLIQKIISQCPPESQKSCTEFLSSCVFINSRKVLEINLTHFAGVLQNLYSRLYLIAKKQVKVLGDEQIALYPHGDSIRKLEEMEGLPDLSNSLTTTELLQKYTCWQYIYFSEFINVDKSNFTQDQLDKFKDLRNRDATLRQKNIYQLFHEIHLVLKEVNRLDHLRTKLISNRETN